MENAWFTLEVPQTQQRILNVKWAKMVQKNRVNEEKLVKKYHKKIQQMSKLAKMMCILINKRAQTVGKTLKCFLFHCCSEYSEGVTVLSVLSTVESFPHNPVCFPYNWHIFFPFSTNNFLYNLFFFSTPCHMAFHLTGCGEKFPLWDSGWQT